MNQKWVTDITYIHVLKEGWTYLATVMDLYDRKIIGYAYGRNMTADLALEAVKNACLNVSDTNGIILHSDLGSQYTSERFEEYMRANGFVHSFSRKGNPYENACIESFHSVMKKEEIYLHTYQDFEECCKALFKYIESWYNRQRIHSALGYKTPQQVEDEAIQAALKSSTFYVQCIDIGPVCETLELYKTAYETLRPLVTQEGKKAQKRLGRRQSLKEQGDHFALRRPEGGKEREQQAALLAKLPFFRYHPNPLETKAFHVTNPPVSCDCCKKSTDIYYDGPFYAVEDIDYVCPECIASGEASRKYDGEFQDIR